MTRSRAVRRAVALAAFAAACSPGRASASCDAGAAPAYGDIDYVKIVSYSLVGALRPWFTFEAAATTTASSAVRVTAVLDAHRLPKLVGRWAAVDPSAAMSAIVDVLRRDDFFAMRLHRAAAAYLDGPEDEIVVGRCGVETVLTTLPFGNEVDLGDAQGRALFRLEHDLDGAIVEQRWRAPSDGISGWPTTVP